MLVLNHATGADVKPIYRVFQQYPDIFPHLRVDYLKRMIDANTVIWHDGVVIVYQPYRRTVRLGNYSAPRGAVCLHQIARSPDATAHPRNIFPQFFHTYVVQTLVLTVRESNARARAFYDRMGMEQCGVITWHQKGSPIPGVVYRKVKTPRPCVYIV